MRYAIIENGKVTNVIIADAEFAAQNGAVLASDECGIGWTYADGVFSPGDSPEPQQEPQPTIFTPFGFLSLFSEEEQYGIANFEQNGAISEEDKGALRTFDRLFRAAQEIDLNDPATRGGIDVLVRVGILASGRAAEILNGSMG